MPIAWERSFGGTDPAAPTHFEPRNPHGRGFRKSAANLNRQRGPNFEDPKRLISNWNDRPAPVGFGPVAPNWPARSKLAGTYDEVWRDERFPLLPEDFDPRFYNSAPEDQQLEGYVANEEVRLLGMTARGTERFCLPDLQVPVRVQLHRGAKHEAFVQPDTVVIEPSERRLTLTGRMCFCPKPDLFAIRGVMVGVLSPGRRRALETGKRYLDLRHLGGNE